MDSDCKFCGIINEQDGENECSIHENTQKHKCNEILHNYKQRRKDFRKNKHGIIINCLAVSENTDDANSKFEQTDNPKICIYAKPKQAVTFSFTLENEMNDQDILFLGVQLGHPQPQFVMNDHQYTFDSDAAKPKQAVTFSFILENEMNDQDILFLGVQLGHPQPQFVMNDHQYTFDSDAVPYTLEKKSKIKEDIFVTFTADDIGKFEMPIMFTFRKPEGHRLHIIREMVITVVNETDKYVPIKNPYKKGEWYKADHFIPGTGQVTGETYKIPRLLKILLPYSLNEKSLEKLRIKHSPEEMDQLRRVYMSTRELFDEGITKDNYANYFHHLLWWEETVARINIKRYNMPRVKIERRGNVYLLEVPGLSEKRPSLLRGDKVYIRTLPTEGPSFTFESTIKDIDGESFIHLGAMDQRFENVYTPESEFYIHFRMNRMMMERMHEADNRLNTSKQSCRVFPSPSNRRTSVRPITRFYNNMIKANQEQKSAVEHIVSRTSGKSPYMVFGPPGTGKTITIVEAILQLVVSNPRNRILVCTDSNMAADHIALALLQYQSVLNINNFLLRANSQTREWKVMPAALRPISNGSSYETFWHITNEYMSQYKIVVSTLLHSAKYGLSRGPRSYKLEMTHVFIDEAGQASEPAALIPITGLLATSGVLVLAGDPKQLGPVCVSRAVQQKGLGVSLMERLKKTYTDLYTDDPNYITMLVKNFRSDPEIIKLPNQLFYENALQALGKPDPLSKTSILGLPGGQTAVVFHAVNSHEQKIGKAPSYFNELELKMLQRYTKALIDKHNVKPKDIGIIAPYIRQVYKMKYWLQGQNYTDIEVGTVEAFQGKEKRVILVSTVRANCKLLDYDARYRLGFLVDDKRFNVALTRAKAKIVIIGNPACLTKDIKWERYMEQCKKNECYFGHDTQQLERSTQLLTEVAVTRFDRCHLTEALRTKDKEEKSDK